MSRITDYTDQIILTVIAIALMFFAVYILGTIEKNKRLREEKILASQKKYEHDRAVRTEYNLKRVNVDKKILESITCSLKYNNSWHQCKYMFENECLTLMIDSDINVLR